jgi:CheY-like chemotaxis protein
MVGGEKGNPAHCVHSAWFSDAKAPQELCSRRRPRCAARPACDCSHLRPDRVEKLPDLVASGHLAQGHSFRRVILPCNGRCDILESIPADVVAARALWRLGEEAHMICSACDEVQIGARVLVVDDNSDAAESMAILLGMLGYEVRVARTGPEADSVALRWCPAFILLELGLPAMDGYEVATRVRQEPSGRATTIIAVTGYGRPEDYRRSRAAGIDHHLLKPVEPNVLVSLLSRPVRRSG